MQIQRTHVVMPTALVKEIDLLVGGRGRSGFITAAAEKELMRYRQMAALKAADGAWKDKDHPELRNGLGVWVKKLRRETEKRFKRVTAR